MRCRSMSSHIRRAPSRTYGARRSHAELVHGRCLQMAQCTVELIARRNELAGLPGWHRYRMVPHLPAAADPIDRRFRSDGPDQLWVTDITEHPTREGKTHCRVVLDVFSRRVVGWSIDSRPHASRARNPDPGHMSHRLLGCPGGVNIKMRSLASFVSWA